MNAKLHIQTASRNGISFLGQSYFTPPFKLVNITENKQSACLHLMVMNSSPGILDGDDYEIKIELGGNSLLQLHTQSYQRLFNMKNGAKQLMEVHLQNDSSFIYLPHPSVPHDSSIFTSRNKIYLNDKGRLLWGEVLTCGRKLNDEVFKFSKFHNVTEVYLNNKMVIKENLLMQPSLVNPNLMGQLEGFTHQASLILIDTNLSTNIAELIHNYLSFEKNILFGLSTIAGNGTIVRILGNGAEQLYHQLKMITSLMQQEKTIKPIKEIYAE